MRVVGGAQRLVGQRAAPTQRLLLDGERGRHVGVDLAVERVRARLRPEPSPARTSSPPSASRSNAPSSAVAVWDADPSFCSTISSPGRDGEVGQREVLGDDRAGLAGPARARRRWSRRGRRWGAPVVVVPLGAGVLRVIVDPHAAAVRRSTAHSIARTGGAEQSGGSRHGRGYARPGPMVHRSPAAGCSADGPPSPSPRGRRPCPAPGGAPRPRSDHEPARADGRPRGAWPRCGVVATAHRLKTAAAASAPPIAWGEPTTLAAMPPRAAPRAWLPMSTPTAIPMADARVSRLRRMPDHGVGGDRHREHAAGDGEGDEGEGAARLEPEQRGRQPRR